MSNKDTVRLEVGEIGHKNQGSDIEDEFFVSEFKVLFFEFDTGETVYSEKYLISSTDEGRAREVLDKRCFQEAGDELDWKVQLLNVT